MSAVDEILHGGEYTDRRGRRWTRSHFNNWTAPRPPQVSALADESQMRLLIERDQHRATCPGLWDCADHPVPAVTLSRRFSPRVYVDGEPYIWLSEAMDAARALAVEP